MPNKTRKQLIGWATEQRGMYRAGKLSIKQIAQLEAIVGWRWNLHLSFYELQEEVRRANIYSSLHYRNEYKKHIGWPTSPTKIYTTFWTTWGDFTGYHYRKPLISKECKECGIMYEEYQHVIDAGFGKYCSKLCHVKSQTTTLSINCETCGEEFIPPRKETRFCSRKCSSISQKGVARQSCNMDVVLRWCIEHRVDTILKYQLYNNRPKYIPSHGTLYNRNITMPNFFKKVRQAIKLLK